MPSNDSDNTPLILKLAVPSPLRRLFDYLPPVALVHREPGFWKPGMRLQVPFGRRQAVAMLVGTSTSSDVPGAQLKHATSLLDEEPLFPAPLLQTLKWAAAYYQHPPGEAFSTALPAKLRQGSSTRPEMESVWEACDTEAENAAGLLSRAPRQRALLERLQQVGPLSRQECLAAGFSDSAVQGLAARGLIRSRTRTPAPPVAPVTPANPELQPGHAPNPEQQAAINAISQSLGQFRCYLLDGITGSGKTEVYMQVIARVLEQGRQALILVPEIGLTPQSVGLFRDRFHCNIVVLHSGLGDAERLAGWLQARDGTAAIVIGTRSAVFTPLAQPGLIVIDEEHDGSFKQQDGFRYSARDLAIFRAREENISIVLGSATPALESLQNAREGRYCHLTLPHRAGTADKAPISLLDMAKASTRDGFSDILLGQIEHHLGQGNQVLVFINRRGFAPSLVCQDCGYVFECRRCDAQLTVHKSPPGLRCHHCESQQGLPGKCEFCGSTRLLTRGVGTEKSEQILQEHFPHIPVLRIDSDSTRRKNALSNRLAQVQSGSPCVLVGTQMLAKGHHFPGVTLVAVLDADSGLFSADFRGQEHMLQLLFQVAGRAGRAQNPGQVIIQTRHAAHVSLQSLVANDYHSIADLLLQERRETNMPPFCHLALFRAESADQRLSLALLEQVRALCAQACRNLKLGDVETHRPLPAPMERRAGKFRTQMLIKASSRGAMQTLLACVCPQIEILKSARKVRWSIDVDPVDLT